MKHCVDVDVTSKSTCVVHKSSSKMRSTSWISVKQISERSEVPTIIGLIVTSLYGITREAAQQHYKINGNKDATFTDNMYEYKDQLLTVY